MPNVPAFADADTRDNIQLTDAASQTYLQGALVVLDASKNVIECGADPSSIYGVACGPAGKHPEGATQTTISKVWNGQKFWMAIDIGTAATRAANENRPYGVVKGSDGIWVVDTTDTVNTRVYVHFVDIARGMALVSVLQANRQISA